MPLTQKGKEIMRAMKKEYGKEKGEGVFYASRNKGTISGVKKSDSKSKALQKKLKKQHVEL